MTIAAGLKKRFLMDRPRRRRHHPGMRALIREHSLSPEDFIFPLFIKHGLADKHPVGSMPGLFQYPLEQIADVAAAIYDLGIPAVLLFGIPEHKDALGADSYSASGIVQQAIVRIKDRCPDLLVITDACFCEYTEHGHCGVMNEHTGSMDLDNDATLDLLVKQAIAQATAGADMIAPSGMIDGMIAAIRYGLDDAGFSHIPIMSYSAKFASSAYGPFREATEGVPQFGDRKTYQLDMANGNEALWESQLDVHQGADILMVKPAGLYLDIIYRTKQAFTSHPLAAYQVSGEYSMIKAAAAQGWLDEEKIMFESLLAIKRAGADIIISYFAPEVVKLIS